MMKNQNKSLKEVILRKIKHHLRRNRSNINGSNESYTLSRHVLRSNQQRIPPQTRIEGDVLRESVEVSRTLGSSYMLSHSSFYYQTGARHLYI